MTASEQNPSPWYAELFLALGGWLAGLLAAIAIFAMAGAMVVGVSGDGADVIAAFIALIVGGLFALMGVSIGRRPSNDFLRHFAIASIAAGLTAATGGLWYLVFRLIGGGQSGDEARMIGLAGVIIAGLLAAINAVIVRIVKDGILAFIATLAVYGVLVAALVIFQHDAPQAAFRIDHMVAPVCVFAGAFLFLRAKDGALLRAAAAALMLAPMVHYLIINATVNILGVSALISAARVVSDVLYMGAALYCLWLLRNRYPLAGLLPAAALLLTGIWLLPAAGAVAIVILCAGIAANHRGLSAVGVASLAWFISRYYYDLSASLLEKSLILFGMGAATLIGAVAFRRFVSTKNGGGEKGAPAASPRRNLLSAAGFAALLLIAGGLVNHSVWRLETGFNNARTIYLPLGPVDPRSIIQGDYMVLNFRREIYPPADIVEDLPRNGQVILSLGENNVPVFSRLAEPGETAGAGEVLIDYLKSGRRSVRYCPTSFFFQEGDADIYTGARFAVVLVAPAGNARLIGLADENFKRLGPGN